ncbi:hypothetical protein Elgi_37030 [Paenibacillus elgii]|nr:hypothetical protein Elgi_37030 [Paenibacillus elgii]
MKKMIRESGNYVQVYEECSFRKGWIIVLQVTKSEWLDSRYDIYRR